MTAAVRSREAGALVVEQQQQQRVVVYDYAGAPPVLRISANDGLIEKNAWCKFECRITAVGRGLFLCPSVKTSKSNPSNSQRSVSRPFVAQRSGVEWGGIGGGVSGGGEEEEAVFHPLEMENACTYCSIHECLQESCTRLVPVQCSSILQCSSALLAPS